MLDLREVALAALSGAAMIPADEPAMLIRGSDQIAPEVLRFYAQRAKAAGASPKLVAAVQAEAAKIEAWQIEHGATAPTIPGLEPDPEPDPDAEHAAELVARAPEPEAAPEAE